ncbi:50S ribosomal protein L25 [Paenibacillus marinisediminis]
MSGEVQTLHLAAEMRTLSTRSDLQTLRDNGRIPAVVYGAQFDSIPVHVDAKEASMIASRGISEIFNLSVAGKAPAQAIIKEVQRRNGKIMHIDLQLVRANQRIRVPVPIEYVGTAKGVKSGGMLHVQEVNLNIEALPDDIPASIVVDLTPLEVGEKILAGSLVMPEDVHLINHVDDLLVSVIAPRVIESNETVEVEE